MTINKRRKNSRLRGSKTHGWGAMKKHRSKGNKGGAGRAGTGKRGDAKKPSYWHDPRWQGKYGFKKKNKKIEVKGINISYLDEKLEGLLKKGLIKDNKGVYEVDLQQLGYNKLLSGGNALNKYRIKAVFASEKAIEKIKNTGGEIIPQVKQEKKIKEGKEASKKGDN